MNTFKILILITMIQLVSCSDNWFANNDTNAKVKIRILDNNNVPLIGSRMKISASTYSTPVKYIETEILVNGSLDTNFAEGSYSLWGRIDSANCFYTENKSVTLIGGNTKEIVFYPLKITNDFFINLKDRNKKSIPGINVAILGNMDNNDTTLKTFEDTLSHIVRQGITDFYGTAAFRSVPISNRYSVMIYKNNKTMFYGYSFYFMSRNNDTIYFEL